MTNKLPWNEIERRIHALRDEMPLLIERFPDAKELMPRFAELAGEILEAVDESRVDEASVRICDILFDHAMSTCSRAGFPTPTAWVEARVRASKARAADHLRTESQDDSLAQRRTSVPTTLPCHAGQ